ncbi:MAG: PAS domain S-box protein [Clostridia bacterium]|nr:PAS domain S-box protein [Clostridia bacterium]
MKKNNQDNYYANIRFLTFVIPFLGIGAYEVIRFQLLDKYFEPHINSLILMILTGIFGSFFATWLFKKIEGIHNTLFWEQQRLKTIFQHTSDGIVVLDENLRVLDINPAAEKLTGWSKKEVIEKLTCNEMLGCLKAKESCWNSQDPEDCMNVDCGHRECWGQSSLTKKLSFPYIEMCILRKDGRKIKVGASYSYIPSIGEEKPQIKIVLRDISQKKEFEKAIQNYATLEERYRLAREMHDGLAQALVYLNIKAQNIQKKLQEKGSNDSILKDITELRQITQEAVNEVRQNIFDLKTQPVENSGCFRVWIEEYLNYFGSVNHIETEFVCNCQEALVLPTEMKVQLIRIVQEALSNIRKHARATKASIFLSRNNQELIIKISDNGKGIDVPNLAMSSKNHFGLSIMEERAQIIGADLKVLPAQPRGTIVEIRLSLGNLSSNNAKVG